MVVALGPGKFYGSSLPRPRIYNDVKFNDERVDPPVPVLDPLMSWAQEAHWSMGGLSFQRLRLQGRIEGNVKKLRAERERSLKKRKESSASADQLGISAKGPAPKSRSPSPPPAPIAAKRRRIMALMDEDEGEDSADQELGTGNEGKRNNNGRDGEGEVRRRSARKLGDVFDRVASESSLSKSRGSPVKNWSNGSETVATRTRSRKSETEDGGGNDVPKAIEEVSKSNSKGKKLKGAGKAKMVGENGGSTPVSGTRTSPRLARRVLC